MTWREARARYHYRVANLFLRLRRYEAAANSYERGLSIRQGDPHLQFQRAWCLLEVPHRRTDAIIAFQKLLIQTPSSGGYYLLARGLQSESRHQEAVEAFGEATRRGDCEIAEFYNSYAVSLEAVRRFEEAVDAYRTAAQLNPSDAGLWANLGALLAELGRWKDAAPCQERAMRLAPSVPHAVHLASTLYQLDRLSEAERVLRTALLTDARSVELREWLVFVLTGQDRYEEAIAMAREAAESPSAPLSSRVALAVVLSEAGCLDEALRVAKAVVDTAPQDAIAHGTLGGVYLKMKAGGAALESFERATCLAPEPAPLPSSNWIRYASGRAVALSLLGRHDEAMAGFEEVLRTDPEFLERWPEVASHYQCSSQVAGQSTEAGRLA